MPLFKKYFQFDKTLFVITATLVVFGLFVFLSASFSAFGDIEKFKGILFNQLVLGFGGGIILFLGMLTIPDTVIKKYSLAMYIVGIVLLLMVFIPGLGFSHGGARRWLSLGPLSFQPVEFVKYATIIYVSAWLASLKSRINNLTEGLIPLGIILGIIGGLLLLQPDTDSFLIIGSVAMFLYFLAGARWRDVAIVAGVAIIGIGVLIATRPYIMNRVKVFLDPTQDVLGSSYQSRQQLIAIGSGGFSGRGFGQSIQKFKYLPEPLGDSIYSVVGEEFGFLGSLFLVILYTLFFFRGIWVATRVKDPFLRFSIIGIVCIIVFQSFYNIASSVGILPLGGTPLIFVSHGGTALAFSLGAMGLVLNMSRKMV